MRVPGRHRRRSPVPSPIRKPDPRATRSTGPHHRIAAPLQRYPLALLLLDGGLMAAACAGESPIIPVNAPDSVGPAAMALTRTPWGASSSAQQRVRCSKAALLAA